MMSVSLMPEPASASGHSPIHRSAWKRNSANFACTEFSEVRSGRSCIPILQLFEQTLYQDPVNFVYPDPTAHVLHGKLYLVGSCAAVPHLQMANIVQVHVQRFGEAVIHVHTSHRPPTWIAGRFSGSCSAFRNTSWVTGAVSPSPSSRKRKR